VGIQFRGHVTKEVLLHVAVYRMPNVPVAFHDLFSIFVFIEELVLEFSHLAFYSAVQPTFAVI
jgi:hypothetical protein